MSSKNISDDELCIFVNTGGSGSKLPSSESET